MVKKFESPAILQHMVNLCGGAHCSIPFVHLDTLYLTILCEEMLNKR